jgi:hypothetical protein
MRQERIAIGGMDFAFRHQLGLRRAGLFASANRSAGARARVMEKNSHAGACRGLRDTGTHGASAENGDNALRMCRHSGRT